MNMRKILAGATVILLTTGNVWAQVVDATPGFNAPEIDAASGTSALVLLTGALLLVAERYRSKRT